MNDLLRNQAIRWTIQAGNSAKRNNGGLLSNDKLFNIALERFVNSGFLQVLSLDELRSYFFTGVKQ